jgi:tetratricopeptide (TPR) repeat protein
MDSPSAIGASSRLGLEAAHFDGFMVIEGSEQKLYRMYGMATKTGNNIFGLVILALVLRGYALTQTTTNEQIAIHYKRAEAALKVGESQTAAAEFKEILKLDPANAEASANLGVMAYKQGDLPQAKQLFSDALKRDPSLWDAKALLGLCHVRLGDPNEGIPLLTEAFPHIRNQSVKIDAGVALIRHHEEQQTLGQVVNVIRDLEDANPDNPEVLYVTYRAYSDLAAQALARLSQKAPDSGHVHQILGEAAMAQDDFPGAILQFKRAIEADTKIPGIHYELGRAILTNSQDAAARQEAQRELETELRADPADFNSEYELGEVYRLGSNLQLAEEHFERALQLRPDFVDAQVGLGNVLVDEGKPEEAIPHFAEAVRLDPDNEGAHYKLAREYRAVGRDQDAAREMLEFQRVHQLHAAGPSKSSEKPSDPHN